MFDYEWQLGLMADVLKTLNAPAAAQQYVQHIVDLLDHKGTLNSVYLPHDTLVWNQANALQVSYAAAQDSDLLVEIKAG
ncbi:hypothetical protein, partial [Staphylococcus aureus]